MNTNWENTLELTNYKETYSYKQVIINSQTPFKPTTTITNLLLNSIQIREAHKINRTLAVADTQCWVNYFLSNFLQLGLLVTIIKGIFTLLVTKTQQ